MAPGKMSVRIFYFLFTIIVCLILLLYITQLYDPSEFTAGIFYRDTGINEENGNRKDEGAADNGREEMDPPCGYIVAKAVPHRLGNQMFLYASFYGIIRKYHQANKVPIFQVDPKKPPPHSAKLDNAFDNLTIPRKELDEKWFEGRNRRVIGQSGVGTYDERGWTNMTCDGENVVLAGYRQSYKYFIEYRDEMKKEFTFKYSIREQSQKLIEDNLKRKGLKPGQCTIIGIHARRGDFLGKNEANSGYVGASVTYLKTAVKFFEKILLKENGTARESTCLAFLMFGDDYEWNKETMEKIKLLRPNNSHLIPVDSRNSTPAVDLCSLSSCDHMIMTTGTFGWWAAFLNNGVVTYQKKYVKPNTFMAKAWRKGDIFLPQWIAL